jgi:hypothetical protein
VQVIGVIDILILGPCNTGIIAIDRVYICIELISRACPTYLLIQGPGSEFAKVSVLLTLSFVSFLMDFIVNN